MHRLIEYMKTQGAEVDKALEKYLPRLKEEPAVLHEAMRYSTFAGGKRLRPALVLMACELLGGEKEKAMPAACAIEMIHTYSLIHDDLPAMDDDDYRRGKLSCHKAFGEAIAILAGDALLTLAFETIAKYSDKKHTADLVLSLSSAAGQAGMVGGQVLDIEKEGEKPGTKSGVFEIEPSDPIAKVEAIHSRKTGALITSAVEMGAIVGGADKDQTESIISYGRKIGLAFQIKDDILDIESSSEKLGKTVGKDENSGKITYPAVLGMDKAKELLKETIIDAKRLLAEFKESALMLRLLADFIEERDH
ncbi:MAG: polyprenyl synthetase family protein [Planctomycetota bacterium]|jgi:geranylgeranyl diphosphate synthase type II